MIDYDKMNALASEFYFPFIDRQHGKLGINALRQILGFIQQFYLHVAPETRTSMILVFKHLNDLPADVLSGAHEAQSVHHMPPLSQQPIVAQIFENGRMLLSQSVSVSPEVLAQDGVVYRYQNRIETIHAKNEFTTLPNPLIGYASMFAIPTFDDLKTALYEYKTKQARKCSCLILADVWIDENRLLFRSAPEKIMRNSLTQFLKHTLRGNVEVRPEQIVNATRPVDIKVTWFMTNRLALIEIKWIGASKGKKGKLTKRFDGRAREGAKQLADYLDANVVQAPIHESRGYLVVLDGRRGALKASTKQLSTANGLKYESKEITYSPEFHKKRNDFEVPFRMFIEPICTL